MAKWVRQSLLGGFITGTVFLAVAPFGLNVAGVEFLRPVLIPGIDLCQPLLQKASRLSPIAPLMGGLLLNGAIYAALFLILSLIQRVALGRAMKAAITLTAVLAFLAITGMLSNLYYVLISPNRSWIFHVGP